VPVNETESDDLVNNSSSSFAETDSTASLKEKSMSSVIEDFEKSYFVQSHREIVSGMLSNTMTSSNLAWEKRHQDAIQATRLSASSDNRNIKISANSETKTDRSKKRSNWLREWEKKVQQRSMLEQYDGITIVDDDTTIWNNQNSLIYKQCNIIAYLKSHGKINHYCGK
jgi:hypothetical protein